MSVLAESGTTISHHISGRALIDHLAGEMKLECSNLNPLCIRHLVPLTDLKPVNPVPAWNIAAPARKGELGMYVL